MLSMWGKRVQMYTVTGPVAALIEAANHASFYGVNAGTREAAAARRAISDTLHPFLDEYMPTWAWYNILRAKSEDTSGTPTPYKATVIIEVDYT